MVVVMTPEATDADIAHVVERVESVGGEAFVSKGVVRTIIGLVGDIESFHGLNLRTLPGVADSAPDLRPVQLASRQHHPDRSTVRVGRDEEGAVRPGQLHVHRRPVRCGDASADPRGRGDGPGRRRHDAPRRRLQAPHLALRLPGPRRRRAARSWPGARGDRPAGRHRGDGAASDVDVVAEYADMLQIGARNMQNFALLQRASAEAGKPVLLKRGMIADDRGVADGAPSTSSPHGNPDVVLCERGIRTFETATRNTLDLTAVPVVQELIATCRSSSIPATPVAAATSWSRCRARQWRSARTG